MRLYTLDYDCNLPVTQQVNVATNTDAKIGIKVKKNGEYLNLDGSTLSVEVGNEIVFDPTTINGTRAELSASTTTTNVTLSTDVAGSDYYDLNVTAKKIKVQISYDGTTWEDATPLTSDIIGYWYDLTVDSRRPTAMINMADPQTFNVVFGPDAGKQLTELAWTENTRIQMNANQYAYWDITSYPCYMRICANFQKPNYQEMLSADAELTNGYVTFPITTPDTASYVQDTVIVDVPKPEPIDVNGTSLHIASQLESFVTMVCPLSTVVGNDVPATSMNFEKSADDSTWLSAMATGNINYIDTAISGNSALAQCNISQGQTQWTWIRGELAGLTTDTVPATATSRLQWAGLDTSLSIGYWRLNCETKVYSEATKATFKLNVNTFKSQQGDKEYMPELPYIPSKTVTFAGTYTDNTPFSYDVFYKD